MFANYNFFDEKTLISLKPTDLLDFLTISFLLNLLLFRYNVLTVNMSAQTTSNNVQDIIESRVEKRTKGVYVPLGGKKLLTFMDDFNMPAKDTFGSQPPLELIKVNP